MKNPRSEEEKIIEYIRNLFRLKKEINDTAIKDIRNIFKLKKKFKEIKDRIDKIEYLEILRKFLSMKKNKKIIIN